MEREIREGNDDVILEKAMGFAAEHRKGACRKGADRPYILHLLEVTQILNSMGADVNLLGTILKAEFAGEDIAQTFLEVCDDLGVTPTSPQNA